MTKKTVFEKNIQEKIITEYLSFKSIARISREYGYGKKVIRRILKENNIGIRTNGNESKTQEQLATNRKYKINQSYFENIDSDDKAYWLGFMFADGYVLDRIGENKGKRKGLIVGLALKADDCEHLINFRKEIKSNHPIRHKTIKLKGKEYFACAINIGSVKMGEDLISWGCTPRKSLTLKYPEKLSDEFFPSFLRGYIDGDGCINVTRNKKEWSISMLGTFEFLTSVKNKLEIYQIKCREEMPKNNKSIKNTHVLRIKAESFDNLFNLLYRTSKSSYMMARKYETFQEIGQLRKRKDYFLSETAALAALLQ